MFTLYRSALRFRGGFCLFFLGSYRRFFSALRFRGGLCIFSLGSYRSFWSNFCGGLCKRGFFRFLLSCFLHRCIFNGFCLSDFCSLRSCRLNCFSRCRKNIFFNGRNRSRKIYLFSNIVPIVSHLFKHIFKLIDSNNAIVNRGRFLSFAQHIGVANNIYVCFKLSYCVTQILLSLYGVVLIKISCPTDYICVINERLITCNYRTQSKPSLSHRSFKDVVESFRTKELRKAFSSISVVVQLVDDRVCLLIAHAAAINCIYNHRRKACIDLTAV